MGAMNQEYLDKLTEEYNHRNVPEFEGYSPVQMHYVLYKPFDADCVLKLKKLAKEDYRKIPILNQVIYFLNLIKKTGELKLTKKGFLPSVIVKELYGLGLLKEYLFESGIAKIYKEMDSKTITLTRVLSELSGVVKKRNGKLSLTKKGALLLSDDEKLFKLLFETFTSKFNWSYFDGYKNEKVGQFGFCFTLILLSVFGNNKRNDTFYSSKYFKAYPFLLDEETNHRCYNTRTFERFLVYFGLVVVESEDDRLFSDKYISKTVLFDKLFELSPPRKKA
ncbi:MAG: hypothetical protein COB98_07875 [Flavobacteriaceae bacterium]|nr:MAG: hypothetical protein COB98_07875 [Flavobacteriaceae bacterium]